MSNNDNSPHSLFVQSETETVHHYRLFLDTVVHDGSDIHNMLNTLHNSGDNDTLEIRINSAGGYVKYGQQFINVIRDSFRDRSVTVLEYEALSMGASIFLAGGVRVIYPWSRLLIHNASGGTYGKMNEMVTDLTSKVTQINELFGEHFKGFLSKKEIRKLKQGMDFTFGAKEMCKKGMATHVIVDGEMIEAKEYLETLRKKHDKNSDS